MSLLDPLNTSVRDLISHINLSSKSEFEAKLLKLNIVGELLY